MAVSRSMWRLFLSEFIGTGLLLLAGLSFVILNWGEGSLVAQLLPVPWQRRLLTGFLFGCSGCAVSLSKVGKVSGAHINPAVSIAFWLRGTMNTGAMLGYIASQLLGAVAGCIPLLLWGRQGKSISYGNTVAGNAGIMTAYVGEVVTTAALITLIFCFGGSRMLRHYTPFAIPVLYAVMVCLEVPYSGCSTNPARSFGPAVISGVWNDFWLFWAAPVTGVVLVVAVFRLTRLHHLYRLKTARVSYHDHLTHESLRATG